MAFTDHATKTHSVFDGIQAVRLPLSFTVRSTLTNVTFSGFCMPWAWPPLNGTQWNWRLWFISGIGLHSINRLLVHSIDRGSKKVEDAHKKRKRRCTIYLMRQNCKQNIGRTISALKRTFQIILNFLGISWSVCESHIFFSIFGKSISCKFLSCGWYFVICFICEFSWHYDPYLKYPHVYYVIVTSFNWKGATYIPAYIDLY